MMKESSAAISEEVLGLLGSASGAFNIVFFPTMCQMSDSEGAGMF